MRTYRKETITGTEDNARTNRSSVGTMAKGSLFSQRLRLRIRKATLRICPYRTKMHQPRTGLLRRCRYILRPSPLYLLELFRRSLQHANQGDDGVSVLKCQL